MTPAPIARPPERTRSIEQPLRDEGFPALWVVRDRVSSSGTERGDAERDGERGVLQVEYRVHATGMEEVVGGLTAMDEMSAWSMRIAPVGWLVPLLVSLFLVVGPDRLSHWKESILLRIHRGDILWTFLAIMIVSKISRRITYESITALPGLGIQFTTQKAYTFPGYHRTHIICASSTTTTFIPLSSVRPRSATGADSVFVHEGLQRWGVTYYLGVLWNPERRAGVRHEERLETADSWRVQVGFPNLQPSLPILREVYHGIRETMFDDYAPEHEPVMTK